MDETSNELFFDDKSDKYNETTKRIHDLYYLNNNVCIPKLDLFNTQFLYLKNRDIENIPEDFFLLLPNIKWLDLRDNSISRIPTSVENHKCLETFLLLNNQITHLPVELCTVKKLKHLQLGGNPIRFPKFSIINSGIEILKEYLHFFYNTEVTDKHSIEHDPVDVYYEDDEKRNKNNRLLRFLENSKEIQTECEDQKFKDKKQGAGQHNKSVNNAKYYLNSDRYVKRPKAWSKREMTRRIKEKAKEETSVEKKKKDLCEIDAILQARKTKEELKNWREKYMKNKNTRPKPDFTVELSNLPYGTDDEFAKIFTRSQISSMQESLNKKKQTKFRPPMTEDIDKVPLEKRMLDLEKCLNDIEIKQEGDSPRRHQIGISVKMKKLMELRKKISQLKIENENLL